MVSAMDEHSGTGPHGRPRHRQEPSMTDCDETADDRNHAIDGESDTHLDSYTSEDLSPNGRFVWVTEDLVIDVLTGNQYMPMR